MSQIIAQQLTVKSDPQRLSYGTPARIGGGGESGPVHIYAASGNNGDVYLGNSEPGIRTTNRYTFPAGRHEMFWVDNLEQVYYWGQTVGDILEIMATIRENW